MPRLFVGGNFTTVAGRMGSRRNLLRSSARDTNLQAAKKVQKIMVDNFDNRGASVGSPWNSLKTSTIFRKIGSKGLSESATKVLIRTGKMIRSTKAAATSRWGKVVMKGAAIFHERGTKRMVSRRLLPTEEIAMNAVFPIYRRWVKIIINR